MDPSVVFGVDTTLTHPTGFFEKTTDFNTFLSSAQGTTSRTPAAYAGAKVSIPSKESVTITTVYGHAPTLEEFLHKISPKVRAVGYINKKRRAANALTQDITDRVSTKTSSPLLDLYFKQDYLDNVLRGGLPGACILYIVHLYILHNICIYVILYSITYTIPCIHISCSIYKCTHYLYIHIISLSYILHISYCLLFIPLLNKYALVLHIHTHLQ